MIALVSGTNREGSYALRVAHLQKRFLEEAGAEVRLLDLQKLPPALFTPQAYAKKPAEFSVFSETVLQCEGLMVVTPEYNGGFPGVLKLFIDMLKFPESFEKRPVAFVGEADGYFGALRPIEQLVQIFQYRNAHVFNERVMIPHVTKAFDEAGTFTNPGIEKMLRHQAAGFVNFCKQLHG